MDQKLMATYNAAIALRHLRLQEQKPQRGQEYSRKRLFLRLREEIGKGNLSWEGFGNDEQDLMEISILLPFGLTPEQTAKFLFPS